MKAKALIAKLRKMSADCMEVSVAKRSGGGAGLLFGGPLVAVGGAVFLIMVEIGAAKASVRRTMTLRHRGYQVKYQLDPNSEQLPNLPVRLPASSAQQGTVVVLAAAITALEVWVAQQHPVMGYLGAAFFACGTVTSALELALGRNYLELTEQGFTVVRLLRSYHLAWSEVSHFSVVSFIANSFVTWDYSPKVRHRLRLAWLSRLIIGADGGLRNYALDYGFTPKGFALLLNRFRDRYA